MPPRGSRQRPNRWERFVYWLKTLRSPLDLRGTLKRLSGRKHPYLELLGLLIPYPSWYFPLPPPPSPRALIDDKKNGTRIIYNCFQGLNNTRSINLWSMRDTPLRSLYRLYMLHLSDNWEIIGYETEYFFFHANWKVVDIPDPKDQDPIRYALLASITEELHEAVNWRLSIGLRRNGEHIEREELHPPFIAEDLPSWTKDVPPIDKDILKLTVPPEMIDDKGNFVLDENGEADNFLRRNIITSTGWLYTV